MIIIVDESAFQELLDFGLQAIPSMTDLHGQDWRDDYDGWETDDCEKNSERPFVEAHAFGHMAGDDGEDLGGQD